MREQDTPALPDVSLDKLARTLCRLRWEWFVNLDGLEVGPFCGDPNRLTERDLKGWRDVARRLHELLDEGWPEPEPWEPIR